MVLTNLAAHAYPAGSRRRAVLLFAGGPDDAGRLVATLSPVRPGAIYTRTAPALAPGERRTFELPIPPNAEAVSWKLIYRRNIFEPDSYSVQILAGTRRVGG